jgi:predicted dehydrogenase/nucleoside-diphosphate-sugar epimerase
MMKLNCKKVVLCGHRSFASQGLGKLLEDVGCEVTKFSRGEESRDGNTITGKVSCLHVNPLFGENYDTVINYIVLANSSVEENEKYIESLLEFCKKKNVKHLIHISSISVYKANVSVINETAAVETEPRRKGSYGSLKVAQDEYIKKHLPNGIQLSLVRPGFILGEGLVDPIVGTGFRTPWNKLLVIGNSKSYLPVVSRDMVNQAIVKVLKNPSNEISEVLVLVDSNSPRRDKYLEACNHLLGCGTGVISLPVIFWLAAGVGGEIILRLLGKGNVKPLQKIRAACKRRQFHNVWTQKRLGMSFSMDWRETLCKSMDSQEVNFKLPYNPPITLGHMDLKRITYLGFGRIVHQKHLPALIKLGFGGDIDAYDLHPISDDKIQNIQTISKDQIDSSDLFVVATPGPAHIEALDILKKKKGKILLEKPLCYTLGELKQWEDFNKEHFSRVFVCHNYRFKKNVQSMLAHISTYNPGKLRNVSLIFQSQAVSKDDAVWLRKERQAHTLLIDYALHFLDLACMFGDGPWTVDNVHYELNTLGQTSLIDGRISCNTYLVNFLLRQGFMPRKAHLIFTFQNYSVNLRFFPDTFAAHMANDNSWMHKMEARRLRSSTGRKVVDKLFSKDSDLSHAYTYFAVSEGGNELADAISFNRLYDFYDLILKLCGIVYED